ncbi:MAG: hypothetical protein EKK55_24275 [Rhodocyclaceae bacterium]|nr:MAG: hypothetical protein EKK55_24275 [Rhodocyclaceae bacterium]
MTGTRPDWTPASRLCPVCQGARHAPAHAITPGAPCFACAGTGRLDSATHRHLCAFVAGDPAAPASFYDTPAGRRALAAEVTR